MSATAAPYRTPAAIASSMPRLPLHKRISSHFRHALGLVFLLVGAQVFGYAASCALGGCVPLEAKQATADTTYEAEHWACVQDHNTRAEIDACREAVRIRWGVKLPALILKDAGIADTGADQ